MSNNVASRGTMVPLNRTLLDEEREEWSELLYDKGSSVRFNYDGTIAYTEEQDDGYGITFGMLAVKPAESFKDLEQFNLTVDMSKARSYSCYWYNGSDSDMDMMTLEEFLEQTSQ